MDVMGIPLASGSPSMRSVTFSSGSIVLRMLCRVQQKVLRMILIISINKKLVKVLLPFLLNLMSTKLMGLMALRFFTLKSCVSLRLKLLPTFLTKSFKQVTISLPRCVYS